MTNIHHERSAADGAEAVVRNVSASALLPELDVALESLRTANQAAITAAGASPLADEHLNNARGAVAIALSALIDGLNRSSVTQDVIDRAKRAVEHWKSMLAGG